uniref:Ig-like domain-containing protein n=1 Tax=Sinocyclocheilus rhinocerous TaxID=307959 RepID=A0A673LML5_9TELE
MCPYLHAFQHLSIYLIALGAQDVQTVSQVSVQERRSIVIPCWYNRAYVNNVKYLSFGDHWTFSKYIEFSDGREKHETVSVSDNKSSSIVSIDMRNIQQTQSGTYNYKIFVIFFSDFFPHLLVLSFSCLGIAGLYVQDQMLAGFEGGSVTVACYYHLPRKTGIKWCKLTGNCVLEPGGLLDGASVEIRNSNGVVSVSVSRPKKENTGWYWCSVRELQMPVHITVSTREETCASTPETTSKMVNVTSFSLLTAVISLSLFVSLFLKVVKTLLWSCSFAIRGNGNTKIYI